MTPAHSPPGICPAFDNFSCPRVGYFLQQVGPGVGIVIFQFLIYVHLSLFIFEFPDGPQYSAYKIELMNLVVVLHFSSEPELHSQPDMC